MKPNEHGAAGMLAAAVILVVTGTPVNATLLDSACRLETVMMPMDFAHTTSTSSTDVLICKSGTYTSTDASQPPDTGDYLDVSNGRVMHYDSTNETMTDAGEAIPPEHGPDQTGQCGYLNAGWNAGGTYTYGRCFSLSVSDDLTYRYRLSTREVNGTVLTGKIQFHFQAADRTDLTPDKEVEGVVCSTETRAGVTIANCDRAGSGSLPHADIPANAAYYCGIGRVYKTVGGEESEALPAIFLPCHPVPVV